MFADKKVLAVIPARGGSKGLPGKNIKMLDGKPLIAWSIELAKQCEFIDRVVVSTDDDEIASVAAAWGADVPFKRPATLASDTSPTIDTLRHCIDTLDGTFDNVVLLQATTPLRTLQTLNTCIETSITANQVVISVSESKKPVEWMFYRHDNGFNYVLDGIHKPTRRQDCKPAFYVDGNVYCMSAEHACVSDEIFDEHSLTVVSQPNEAVDIDTIDDFEYCEYLLKGKK